MAEASRIAQQPEHMVVVGAGLVGSLWALMLAQRGHRVDVYERRPDPRIGPVKGGRSINLALSDRGWRALEKAGIAKAVRDISLPIEGRLMHAQDGALTFQRYGLPDAPGLHGDPQCIYSVSRANLNRLLVEAAEAHDRVHFHFGYKCTGVDLTQKLLALQSPDKSGINVAYDRLFGTDGAFSAVRDRLTRTDRFDFEQRYLEHGYKEVAMQPDAQGAFKMQKDALHIWPRGEFMLMALPNPDGTFTCTLFAPYAGANGLDQLQDPQQALAYFEQNFPDVLPLIPDLTDQWATNPVSSLVMTRCFPWHHGDSVCLMGDAAHAIVPFYGQGMNSGMEDCSILSELLDTMDSPADWDRTLSSYTAARKPAGDAILELALRNYIEMRDKTGDPQFLLQKRIEAKLAKTYPGRWLPLYSQVTFSQTPYQEALAAGHIQDRIMADILAMPNIEEKWDSDEVAEAAMRALENPQVSA